MQQKPTTVLEWIVDATVFAFVIVVLLFVSCVLSPEVDTHRSRAAVARAASY